MGLQPHSDLSRVRVLYSYASKLGGGRADTTAWQQVHGLAQAGADVLVFPGVLKWPLPECVQVRSTLSRGRIRVPYKILGTLRAYALHDYLVAYQVEKLAGQIDVIHTWPLAATRTLKVAARLGIPTVYERPNAHTQVFYEVVRKECQRLGIVLPPGHEHLYAPDVIRIEEEEYRLATRIACPSDYVRRTFMEKGFPPSQLARHQYGYSEREYYPGDRRPNAARGLSVLFAGGITPVKGLHFALEAWLQSSAHLQGRFLIAGQITPEYAQVLAPMLRHYSVRVLGFRKDLPELMRESDILVCPSLSEGFPLVLAEARGSGCVALVSDVCCETCHHLENALLHRAGDVEALSGHFSLLHEDRALLARLRAASLASAHEITWTAAGVKLLDLYRRVIADYHTKVAPVTSELRECTTLS